MSRMVRLWLKLFALYERTVHADRLEIDKEIEKRKGVNCDEAIEHGLVTEEEFREIVMMILKRKKKKEIMPVMV